MNPAASPIVKSADRVLDVLELVARSERGLTHTDIAAALGIPKSSLTPLLRNLLARQYLQQPDGKTFAIGDAAAALGRRTAQALDLVTLARPFVDRLRDRTDESASLSVLRGDSVQRVYGANSSKQLSYSMRSGDAFPAYAAASGKAILAFLPAAERDAFFARIEYLQRTPFTLPLAQVKKQLAQIRRTGTAYSMQESTLGVVSVARAVLAGERPLGALTLHAPSPRFNDAVRQAFEEALAEAADSLGRALQRIEPVQP